MRSVLDTIHEPSEQKKPQWSIFRYDFVPRSDTLPRVAHTQRTRDPILEKHYTPYEIAQKEEIARLREKCRALELVIVALVMLFILSGVAVALR